MMIGSGKPEKHLSAPFSYKRIVMISVLGRGQRRHRDRGTGSIPDIFEMLLNMKKLIGADQRGYNKDQSCQKLLNLVEK